MSMCSQSGKERDPGPSLSPQPGRDEGRGAGGEWMLWNVPPTPHPSGPCVKNQSGRKVSDGATRLCLPHEAPLHGESHFSPPGHEPGRAGGSGPDACAKPAVCPPRRVGELGGVRMLQGARAGGRVSALCSWGDNLSAYPSGRNVTKGLLSVRGTSQRGQMILGHA